MARKATRRNPEHQYTEKGEFEIALTVTDNGGLIGTATKTIQVGNAAPIAAFSFTSPAKTGETVKFVNESTDGWRDSRMLLGVRRWRFKRPVEP